MESWKLYSALCKKLNFLTFTTISPFQTRPSTPSKSPCKAEVGTMLISFCLYFKLNIPLPELLYGSFSSPVKWVVHPYLTELRKDPGGHTEKHLT